MNSTHRFAKTGSVAGAIGAAFASGAAAMCCIGPLGLTILGVNGMIVAAGVKPYRFYLLGLSAFFLAIAFWNAFRNVGPADIPSCSTRTRRVTRGILWTSSIVWLAAFVLQFIANKVTL